MTTYNTGNPVGSTDPRDLYDNAQNMDNLVNGSTPTYADRLGVQRRTLAQIDADAQAILSGIGYAPPVAYASGISLTLTTQTVEYSGEVYAPKLADLPFTTSGTFETAKFRLIQGLAAADLAASGGASLVGYLPAGTGAVATDVQSKLRESVSVKDFGAVGDGVADDTAAIQRTIDAASLSGEKIVVTAGVYKLVPSTPKADEAGTNVAALVMRSGMHIEAELGAVFKIAGGTSSDASPLRHSMFFSNEFLENVSIVNLTMDMNGQNNPISPNRASLSYNRFTNAQVIFSGTPVGVAAGANNVRIENCVFKNNAGVSCIVMAQSNTAGVTLGRNWKLLHNKFENVGIDTDDHSSVFGWATDVLVSGNTFTNPAPYSNAAHTGGLVAYEIHGSDTRFVNNHINNFYQGLWASINITEDSVQRITISGNTAKVSQTFVDFYSANLGTGPSIESAIHDVVITDNVISILNVAVADQIKAVFKIAARRMPSRVLIANNVCRSFETTKSTCLSLIPVIPDQLAKADQIVIRGNVAAGLQAGLVCYFGGTGASAETLNVGRVEFSDNRLGYLVTTDGVLLSHDVFLYGASAGIVEDLTVYGLEHATKPIITDSFAGGRATVKGKTLLDLPVTWSGVTIGNGNYSKKISLDTDSGHAIVDIGFIAGSTTTYAGNIAPTIAGLVADSNATATAMYSKTGAVVPLASLIFNTGSAISLYVAGGAPFDSSIPDTSSFVFVNAAFPCRSASV